VMRTDDEIIAHIDAVSGSDFFGTQTGDLIVRLPFDKAKQFLKPEATSDGWEISPRDREAVLDEMKEYMDFAWGKANDCRGLSAGRSLDHMRAWLWLAGEDGFLGALRIDDYSHYGKPQLRAICERYDWDWESLDNGEWVNVEGGATTEPFSALEEID